MGGAICGGRKCVRRLTVGALALGLSLVLLFSVLPAGASPPGQDAAEGKATFGQKCAGCHSLGGGKLVGPDLKGVTGKRDRDWLVRYIVDPAAVRAANDPVAAELAKEYGTPMPTLGLTQAQAQAVVAYLEAESGGGTATQPQQAQPPVAQGDPEAGRALFAGTSHFANGGPPCFACHDAAGAAALGGGTLGPDLTTAATRFGAGGLNATLAALPFPTMAPVYQNAPLTAEEQANLAAFLQLTGAQQPANNTWLVVLWAVVIFAVLMGLAALLWRNRVAGVRRQLVANSRRPRRRGE